MTAVTATQTQFSPPSPRDRLQARLDAEISAGTVESGDRTALESALDTIDEAMRASRDGASAGTRTSPDQMRAKIESLIDEQVESGALTSDQADELKQLFADAGPKGGPGGPPPPPPEGETGEAESSSASSSDLADLLMAFLKQLQEKTSSTTAYATDGSATSSSSTALVLDKTA